MYSRTFENQCSTLYVKIHILITIDFIFNQSYFHYYLFLRFLLQYYWSSLSTVFNYVLFQFLMFRFLNFIWFLQFNSFIDFHTSLLLLVILSWRVCFYPITMVMFHFCRCWLSFLSFFFVSSFPTSAATCFVCCLNYKYVSNRSYYRYKSSLFFSEHNGIVSPSPLLIVIFWSFSVITHHGWVLPLIVFAAYIGSTLKIDHIIAINHHYFFPITMASFRRHRCWLLYFESLL